MADDLTICIAEEIQKVILSMPQVKGCDYKAPASTWGWGEQDHHVLHYHDCEGQGGP